MSQALILQKLKKRENGKSIAVTLSDVPTSFFNKRFSTPKTTVEVDNYNSIDIYQHEKREKPVDDAKYLKVFNKPYKDVEGLDPFTWTEENGIRERTIDKEGLYRKIYQEYGSGCYNMYLIGGRNPPIEYIIRRTWLHG